MPNHDHPTIAHDSVRAKQGAMRALAAVALLLIACGGPDFTAAQDGGAAAAAAAPTGSAAPTDALDPTGDSSPAPTGSASADGAPAPDSGAPAPDSAPGVVADAGEPPGFLDAATEPACPLPTLTPEDMPAQITWESFFYQKGDECLMCSWSPCGSCPVAWFPVEQNGDLVTAELNYENCREGFSAFKMSFGPCGNEAQECGSWALKGFPGYVVKFRLVADATGWAVADLSLLNEHRASAGPIATSGTTCGNTILDPSKVMDSVSADFEKTMRELRWDCP